MEYTIAIALTVCVLVNGVTAQVLGTAIPTLHPPTTSTPAPTPAPKTSTTTTQTTALAPFTCKSGTCDTSNCRNSSYTMSAKCVMTSVRACVTEITTPSGTSTKHYSFRCAAKTCALEKTGAANGTQVMCCTKPNCNSYQAALGSDAPCWTAVTTSMIALVGLLNFIHLCVLNIILL